uniref:EMI domain-containing protein n=1 Tax=Ornithorhynchus anatinus TaxID=9258 RepID=A0A6I8NNC4_ORNAN
MVEIFPPLSDLAWFQFQLAQTSFLCRRGHALPNGGLRNWCSYMVTRTVSCHVQNGTFLQKVLHSCRWPLRCPGNSYKTVVRPTYKVMYKTVTSLEWKCCPGHVGTNCEEGREMLPVSPPPASLPLA